MKIKAKKSYGQNFLVNELITEKIVHQFNENRVGNRVLEVGPGRGALTKYFIKQSDIEFKAVEADWEMVHYLQKTYGLESEKLIQEDFLKLPLDKIFQKQEFNIVGNFPYNISSQILFRAHKYADLVPFVMGMFQKEVAHRVVSGPGSKVYGIISVLIQSVYDAQLHFEVPPESFEPAPKVTSAIISLKRKEDYTIPCDPKLFRTIVKAAFGQRRKMLRNTLKPFVKNEALLKSEHFTKRPEQLGLEEYYQLTKLIEEEQT